MTNEQEEQADPTLVKLDQSIITTRLTEQPEQFQALFGYLANQLDGS